MTIKDDVLAAFQKLDPKDDALWNKDGTPKLEAIRNAAGDQKISRDEMAASIGDQRRPAVKEEAPPAPPEVAQVQTPPAPPPSEGDKPDIINTAKPGVDGVEDTATPEKTALIAEAKAAIDQLSEVGAEASAELNAAQDKVNAIEAEKQKHKAVIDANTHHLTHAESVKKIQAQTVKNLAANKERMAATATMLKVSGFAPPASLLDAALANRKRTPEMVQNQAAYHRQLAEGRLKERMGQV